MIQKNILIIENFRVLIVFVFFFNSDQAEARRSKVKEARKRRDERKAVKQAESLAAAQKE